MHPAPSSLGTEVASLKPDEICIRDLDRFKRLLDSPSREEAARLANDMGCEDLRPELLSLMESLGYAAPAPVAADVSNGASPDAKAASEVVHPAPPPGDGGGSRAGRRGSLEWLVHRRENWERGRGLGPA